MENAPTGQLLDAEQVSMIFNLTGSGVPLPQGGVRPADGFEHLFSPVQNFTR